MTEYGTHTVRVASTGHRVEVLAEDRSDVLVVGRAEVTETEHGVTIADVGSRLTIRVPLGADLVIGTDSGRISVEGRVGSAAVVTETGRIEVDQASSVDARTTSGRVEIGHCEGECRVRSRSGRVEIDACGGADVATRSSRISMRHVRGPVRAHCVSGRIELSLDVANDVDAETVSGRVTVALPEGTTCFVTEDQDDPPDGYDCVVHARSVTGRVDVTTG